MIEHSNGFQNVVVFESDAVVRKNVVSFRIKTGKALTEVPMELLCSLGVEVTLSWSFLLSTTYITGPLGG